MQMYLCLPFLSLDNTFIAIMVANVLGVYLSTLHRNKQTTFLFLILCRIAVAHSDWTNRV